MDCSCTYQPDHTDNNLTIINSSNFMYDKVLKLSIWDLSTIILIGNNYIWHLWENSFLSDFKNGKGQLNKCAHIPQTSIFT